MARVVGFEPTHQGVWSRILDLNQYTAETVFKLIHRILLELILESPLPYHLATPVYLCTSPPNPDSPQRTSNSFLRPTGHGLFYLSFCYHYEVHERRNFSCLYERNKRLSGVGKGGRNPICGPGYRCFQPLNYAHILKIVCFLSQLMY